MLEPKKPGATLVDAYYINDEEVEEYVRDRNHYRDALMAYARRFFPTVTTEFQGSEDGEAVVAYRRDGSFKFILHLDPMRINEMKEADVAGELEEYFQYFCDVIVHDE